MLRSILAVILSYIAMAVIIMAIFSAMWLGLGPDRLLVPGTWKGGLLLTIAAPGITLLAGLVGGALCAKIARKPGPVKVLAVVVIVLGLTMAFFTLQKPEPTGPRPAGMTMQQVMEQGREPAWVAVSNPIIGGAAVLIGGLCLGKGGKGCARRKDGANESGGRA